MRAAIRRRPVDRVPMCDSFWDETLINWRAQGHLPEGADINRHFGLEWRLVNFDSSFMLEEVVLEDTPEYMIRRNAYGATARYQKGASAPAEMLEYPVRDRADWDRLKGRLQWHPDRFALTGFYSFVSTWRPPEQDWGKKLAGLEHLKATGDYVALYCYDAFEATWRRMGHAEALVALLEDPVLMREMFEAQIDLLIDGYRGMAQMGATVDGLLMASDLAFRTGLMFSPRLHRELCLPGLTRLCEALHSDDMDMIFHCDGDMHELIPSLIEAGVDCIQPLEVQVGLDVRELKRQYGKHLAFMGNIGVREMLLPDRQLEAVIADKVRTASEGGGYIYHSDHSIPPDVPYEQYLKVLRLVREYGGGPATR